MQLYIVLPFSTSYGEARGGQGVGKQLWGFWDLIFRYPLLKKYMLGFSPGNRVICLLGAGS